MGMLRELYRRWLISRHRPRHWCLRPGTIDRRIFRHVVIDNEYRLPACLTSRDVLLDVGSHTGSFALAALRRGAGRVVCCEPSPDNYRLLAENLTPYADRVELHQAAVWRSDAPATTLALANRLDPRNTGAWQVAGTDSDGVAVLAFDALVERICPPDGRIRLVKFDCEGAEWPILLTARRLDRIEAICGEYHLGAYPALYHAGGYDSFCPDLLRRVLTAHGFQVEMRPDSRSPYPVGLFMAHRPR